MSERIAVAILGASGYGAGELLRLLTQHPAAEVVSVTSGSHAGERIDALHPHLRGFYEACATATLDLDRLRNRAQPVVFSAMPNGQSAAAIESLMREVPERARIIDLSGDYRLRDETQHTRHYAESRRTARIAESFTYGLPELERDAIRMARRIANPGCLATAAILAGAPLSAEALRGPVVVDAKTGSSGSGRTPSERTHHPTRHADFRAYKPLEHQHEPEILQAWGDPHGARIQLSFVAQSMPTARGIFVTLHATLAAPADGAELRRRYEAYYAGSPFVRIVNGSPALQDVVGSNFCDVSVACRGRQVVAMAALDNLVKGMAGGAIQNMNLMCGLTEETGLWAPSYRPV